MMKKVINMINRIYNLCLFEYFKVMFDKDVQIGGRLLIKGERSQIAIGEGTIINSDKSSVPLGFQNQTILWVIGNGDIKIGKYCGITNSSFCSASSIELQDYVTIGGGTKIFDTDFHSLTMEKRIDYINDDDRKTMPVLIKRGAFVGAGCIILKGVTIGEKAVVGAGSVVTKNVPDGEIWAGNPAKYIKKINT